MTSIMQGVKVLEVAEHTFVPCASAILSDWGADVIKVEHVERGDAMRGLISPLWGSESTVHILVEHSNRGKKSIGLDLSKPEGVDLLYRLAAASDVFLTNKLAAVRARLRIDVDDIRAVNPGIIYVRGSATGPEGPDAESGGYDTLSYWCRAGNAVAMAGDGHPTHQPAPAYGDTLGAMTIAGGICGALFHRQRTGEATVVDVSLLSTGVWSMAAAIAATSYSGEPWDVSKARAAGKTNPLVHLYETADHKWVALSMLQGFAYWPEFCQRIGRPELIGDPRFATDADLAANTAAAVDIIASVMAGSTFDEWRRRFEGMRGQWTVVQDTREVIDDPQVVANGYVQELTSENGYAYKLATAPVQFDQEAARPRRAPRFNEHGDEILQAQLGLSWDDIIDLKLKGIVA